MIFFAAVFVACAIYIYGKMCNEVNNAYADTSGVNL